MSRPLLPRLASVPGLAGLVPIMLGASAVLVGPSLGRDRLVGAAVPDLPATVNYWWLSLSEGLLTRSRWVMYPAVVDRVAEQGPPFDALLAWPLVAAFGWPLGFDLAVLAFFAACGVTAGWLGARWWRSPAAGVVTGIAYLSASTWVREVAQGRVSHLAGAVFAPLVVMGLLDALGADDAAWGAGRADTFPRRRRAALGAGAALGAAALTYWYWGFFLALVAGLVLLLAALEGRAVGAVARWTAVGAALVAGVPLVYMAGHLDQHPGLQVGLWDRVVEASEPFLLAELLARRSILELSAGQGVFALRPLLVGLVVLGAWRTPRRRLLLPVVGSLALATFALGVFVHVGGIDVPTPYWLVLQVPVLRRLWWPDRFLFPVALLVAVLVGGGAARLAARLGRPWVVGAGLGAALLAEPWPTQPHLPLPTTPTDTPRIAALAAGAGPVLVLPNRNVLTLAEGETALKTWDPTLYTEQVFFRRPVVFGNMEPDATISPIGWRAVARLPGVADLLTCEGSGVPEAEPVRADNAMIRGTPPVPLTRTPRELLRELGVTVYVDYARAEAAEIEGDYRGCVEAVLGSAGTISGPFTVYAP